MTVFKKFLGGLRKVILFFMAFLTGLNTITIVLQVIFRYFFKISIGWTNELAGVSLVWITFFGATLATIDQTHIGFDMIIKKLSGVPKFTIKTICNLLMLFATVNIARFGVNTVKVGLNTKLSSLPITLGHAAVVVPATAVVMTIAILSNIVKDARELSGKKDVEEDVNALYDDVPEEVMAQALEASRNAELKKQEGKGDEK